MKGYEPLSLAEYAEIFMGWYGNGKTVDQSWVDTVQNAVLARIPSRYLADTDALIESLRELQFCARKLRHSAEAGTERRKDLDRIDAAIKSADNVISAAKEWVR